MKNYAENLKVADKAKAMYAQIAAGYKEEKKAQNENNEQFWEIYNCNLNGNQVYSGDSQVYEPIVRDALEARRKRFTAMLFPNLGQNIECISETGETPSATLSIMQRHVRFCNLRSVVPTLFLNGDIEGQWSLMADWKRSERKIKKKVQKNIEGTEESAEDMEEETIVTEGPEITVIPAQDLWIFPATVSSIQDAEIVSVVLRLTDDAIDRYVEDGKFIKRLVELVRKDAGEETLKWAAKSRAADAGIKIKAGTKFTTVYMVFTTLKLDGEKKPAVVYFGDENTVIGITENPHWCGKIPIMCEPVDRVAGSLWGRSRVEPVAELQYQLNDITNMGMDSASYTLLPIVMTDPLKNPRTGSMIMGKAAIWETSPNDTKFAQFPPLYQHALTLRNAIKGQIMESMDVNETMLGKAPQGRKNAQAIAAQSSEALASVGDVVKRFENGIMNPLLEWFYELDLQYREDDLWIAIDGEHGVQSKLEQVKPQQMNERYHFRWLGADQAVGAQRVQQMIGAMNVFRGIPPDQLNGRKLDLGPILDFVAQATFGPTMAQNILIDMRHKMVIPPSVEVEMIMNGMTVTPNPLDNDIEHLQALQSAAAQTGDPTGALRNQIAVRMKALQAKQAQMQPKGQPGVPGGSGPGVAGSPRPGAMPGQQRPVQGPPGQIHADQMQDPQAQPRG